MCSITSARRLYLATPSQGAGSTHVLRISETFSASSAPFTQFITAPDRRTRLHGHAAISAEVISTTSHTTVLPDTPLSPSPQPLPPQLATLLSDLPSHPLHAYLSFVIISNQHLIDRSFLIEAQNRTIQAVLSFPSLPPTAPFNTHVTLRISNLHLSATALTDHTAGLLLLNHIYNLLGPVIK
jgi:hypothetical protein